MTKDFRSAISGNAQFANKPIQVNSADINKILSTKIENNFETIDNVPSSVNDSISLDLVHANKEIAHLKELLAQEKEKQTNDGMERIIVEYGNSVDITISGFAIPVELVSKICVFCTELTTQEYNFLMTVLIKTDFGKIKNMPIKHQDFIGNGVKSGEIKAIRESFSNKGIIKCLFGHIPDAKTKPVYHFTLNDLGHLFNKYAH